MITSELKNSHKFHVKPSQNLRMTTLDEHRFVQDLLAEPKELLEKCGMEIHQSGYLVKLLTKYAFTELGIKDMKDNQRWVLNTMKDLAKKIYGDDVFTSKVVSPYSLDFFSFDSFEDREGNVKKDVKHSFEPNGYAYTCIFGTCGLYGSRYGSVYHRIKNKVFNEYELDIEMRLLRFEKDIVFYKNEIKVLIGIFDTFHELLVAYSLLLKAKVFETSRVWYGENGHQELLESKHWWTPCPRDKAYKVFCDELGFAPSKVGVVEKSMNDLIKDVLVKMEQANLIVYNSSKFANEKNFKITKLGNSYQYEYIQRKWDFYDGGYRNEHDATTMRKLREGHAYKPIFLELDSEDEVAFSLNYEEYTHGYVFNFIQYLCEIKHPCMERMKCRIFSCKECGERVLELIPLDEERRGRKSAYCPTCASASKRVTRSRKKRKGDVE